MAAKPKLYTFSLSPPGRAAALMLEHKGIAYETVNLLPGLHGPLLRAVGFRGWTVPAVKIDGRRIQGSRQIAVYLEQTHPSPPLYPADPEHKRLVEEAERWGDEVLQEQTRRIFRWLAGESQEVREWVAADVVSLPAPALAARLNVPVIALLKRQSGTSDASIRSDLQSLPALLDHVERLLAEGVIGAEPPNAADFQIATSVRTLMSFTDLAPLIDGRRCAAFALGIVPEVPEPVPGAIPDELLAPLRPDRSLEATAFK